MRSASLALLCLPSLFVGATRLPLRQLRRDSNSKSTLMKRANGQELHLVDTQDLIYIANVTIEGQSFAVQLDTGSSDLWVQTNSVLGKQSDLSFKLTYGIGYAQGPIAQADVSFAGYDIPSQAYLAANSVDNPATKYGAVGVLGTGFTSLSNIDSKVNGTGQAWGRSLLYNIFAQNSSTRNFMAFALQRNDDPDNDVVGTFTISEHEEKYANVAYTAPIPTYPESNPNRWTTLVDKLIVNGQDVSVSSALNGGPSNKAVALMDTGTSYVYAPTSIVNTLYSSLPGASFNSQSKQWNVPCDQEVDVSFVIGGRQFDIHPLDTIERSSVDQSSCIGTWVASDPVQGKAEYDFIFGDATLRSVYTVFDFGDFDSNNKMGNPYLRLWSLVNGSDASVEYHKVMGGSPNSKFTPNTGVNDFSSGSASSSPSSGSGGGSSGTANSVSSSDDVQSKVDTIMKYAPIALGLAALNTLIFIVLVVAGVMYLIRRRRPRGAGKRRSRGKKIEAGPENADADSPGGFIPLPPAGIRDSSYRPVSTHSGLRNSAYTRDSAYEAAPFNPQGRYGDLP